MRQNSNNVDFSQRTAAGDDDILSHPNIRAFRKSFPFHPIGTNAAKAKEYLRGLHDAMNGRPVQDPQTDQDFSTGPTPEADDVTKVPRLIALMQQAEPDMDVWKDDARTKQLHDWMAHALSATQAESEVSRLRQTSDNRGQATHGPKFVRRGDPDHELLNNPEAWNQQRKL